MSNGGAATIPIPRCGRRFVHHAAAFVFYLVVALIVFAPVLGQFTTHCLGHPQGEVNIKVWDQVRTSNGLLTQWRYPEETMLIDYPRGATLFPSDPLNSLLFLPVYVGLGPAARYNISPMAHLVLGAMSAFLLALYLTRSEAGALFAGAAFGFSPYLLTYGLESGSSEAASVAGFPLILLFLIKSVRESSLVNPILAAASLYFLALSSNYYGEFGLLLIFVFSFYLALFARHPADLSLSDEDDSPAMWDRAAFKRLVLFGVAALLLTVPYAIAVHRTVSSPRSGLPRAEFTRRMAGIEAFDPAPPHHSRNGVLLDLVHAGKGALRELAVESRFVRATYSGVVLLGLALYALRRRRKFLIFLAAATTLFLLLYMGPYLQVSDTIYCTTPCNLVSLALWRFFPLFSVILEPFRLHILVTLFLSLMAACGLRDLIGKRRDWWLGMLASILVIAEYFFISPMPFPLTATELSRPAYCEILRNDPAPYAVIELPFRYRGSSLFYKRLFYYQTLHGRAIPNGVTFFPPLMEQVPVFHELLARSGAVAGEPDDVSARLTDDEAAAGFRSLRDMGYGCILVHHEAYTPDRLRDVSQFLSRFLGPPADLGEGVEAYYLPKS